LWLPKVFFLLLIAREFDGQYIFSLFFQMKEEILCSWFPVILWVANSFGVCKLFNCVWKTWNHPVGIAYCLLWFTMDHHSTFISDTYGSRCITVSPTLHTAYALITGISFSSII
jgi:hypothetical protein